MVDWLYGELEPARATEVSGHVDDCARCQTEKAAFTRTREAFAALPELEPPSSLTAMLVREAALSAKSPAKASRKPAVAAESGGFGAWLTGLFRPLMHPAAAAIATLVVVVTVGGTLYLNKGSDQLARPTAPGVALDSDSSLSANSPSEDQAPAFAGEAEPSALAKTEDPAPAKEADSDEVNPQTRGARTAALLEKSRDDRLKDATKKQRAKPAKIAAAPKNDSKRRKTESPKDQFASGFADLEGDGDSSNGDRAEDKLAKEGSFAYAGKKSGWVETKEAQLVTAFKKDDCKAAASIANDIRDRAPKHYKANTADLDAVKKCRYYVTSERKRRTAVARKRAKSKAKKSTGAKADTAKAAASEALDDTADVSSESGL